MKGELIVVTTNDGSPTLFVPELEEHYHSTHGAFTEAIHVFYNNGISLINEKSKINVFEMGFGTGLNTLVAAYYYLNFKKSVYFETIEKYPLPEEILKQISYSSFFKQHDHELAHLENNIKNATWNQTVLIDEKSDSCFELKKISDDINKHTLATNFFDLIFFDAFGPRAQKEMWHIDLLQKMYTGLVNDGFLVTYCANGQMKRDLKEIGFKVYKRPGPPGKREMTIAFKS